MPLLRSKDPDRTMEVLNVLSACAHENLANQQAIDTHAPQVRLPAARPPFPQPPAKPPSTTPPRSKFL